jgi:outer membrane protein OmpA-like peptidoglycan-associated protein
LIPSVGVKFNLTNLLGKKTREMNREGLQFETAAAPLYNGSWGVGLGFEVPLSGVDREAPVISVSYPETEIISPNNDGKSDLLEFGVDIQDDGLIKGYSFVITDVAGNIVREYRNVEVRPENIGLGNIIGQLTAEEQSVPVPEKLIWNGRTESGFVVDDGTYAFRLEAWDNRDNRSSTDLYKVVVDNEKPELTVAKPASDTLLFSPDGDGNKDTFTIEQTGSAEKEITAQIVDSDGNPVKEWTWSGIAPEDITWDGKDEDGDVVEDGIYGYRIVSEDRAENTAAGTIENIIVNTQVVSVFLSTNRSGFSPNSDGNADTVTLFPYLSTAEGLESWKVEIYGDTTGTVHQFAGDTDVPESLVWTGFTDQGEVVEGMYRARLSAEYTSGAEPQAITRPFVLDVSAPEINVSLSPTPFSPDNDGVEDRLYIDLGISDTSSLENWELIIMDDRGNRFNSFSGSTDPGRALIWNGISSDGELVQSAKDYPYTLSVTDELGNTAATEGFIPVDVLVIREDGKLKIRISNITFEPNSPELVTQNVKVFEKNIDILNRIAETLEKYASYDVRIEGHAVRVHWDDKELGEKEEREELVPLSRNRAQTVKDALVERGIDPDRLSVKGMGGRDPLVPHSDLDNRWKNRRVEFILLK